MLTKKVQATIQHQSESEDIESVHNQIYLIKYQIIYRSLSKEKFQPKLCKVMHNVRLAPQLHTTTPYYVYIAC